MVSKGNSKPAIRLQGLSKAFHGHLGIGRTPVVRDLTLRVETGEIFGLLGPNGAGKTTTIKMMLGLLRPDQGTVELLGGLVRDPRTRTRVGFLPENPYFYDYLTAEEFLDFYGRLQALPAAQRRERVRVALDRVGLRGRGGVALRKFSKGMVQRLGLAQAIQHEPELVILDEPMSGLDPIGRREVRDLILALKASGKTIFFSSHILQDAEMICDRVAILQDGSLRWQGRLHDVLTGHVPWFEVAIHGPLPRELELQCISSSGQDTLVRVSDVEELTGLLSAVARSGARVLSVWPRRETLEDLFLRKIGRSTDEEKK